MIALWLAMLTTLPQVPDSVPDRIVAFASSKLGERVGDGQCTGLVTEALQAAGARRPARGGEATWGEPVDAVSEIRPGDILDFKDAVFVRKQVMPSGAIRTSTATMEHHVAIVSAVQKRRGSVRFAVLHQNAGPTRAADDRRQVVQRWVLDPADLRGGTVKAYRPVPDDSANPDESRR